MKIVGSYIMRAIAGESVLVPVGKTAQEFNGMITLNEVAAFIWERLEKVDSAEELAQLVEDEFEVTHEVALQDVTNFTKELNQAGFVIPTREDRTW